MKQAARNLVRRTSVVGLLLVLVTGCSDGADDSADTARDSSPVRTAAAGDDNTPPPNLPTHWSEMTSRQIVKHAEDHGYHAAGMTPTSHRECSNGRATAECNLEITPLLGVRKLDTAAVDTNGVIIARIRNTGTLGEAHVGIPAGDTLYWLVVRIDGALKSYLLDLSRGNPRGQNRANFRVCPQPHQDAGPNDGSRAAFRRCPGRQAMGESIAARVPLADHTSPPWTSCSLGCCYADVPEGGP